LSRYHPKPYEPPQTPDGQVNLTDPDSHLMMGNRVFVQGYNAQAVVTADQIVLAAEITTEGIDFSQLEPMVDATERELTRASITITPEVAVADAGYWNERHMDALATSGIAALIPPDAGNRKGERPGWTGGRYSWMRQLLASDLGGELYRKRKQSIEPVFGHTKHNRKFTQFHRRGRGAVRTEWRLLMMTHNLTKLHRHQIATAGP
jgi:Transposase DDE domain